MKVQTTQPYQDFLNRKSIHAYKRKSSKNDGKSFEEYLKNFSQQEQLDGINTMRKGQIKKFYV